MKKLISLVLVALFVFSLSVSAFAAETEAPATMYYNRVELPNISTLSDYTRYTYHVIWYCRNDQYYYVAFSNNPFFINEAGSHWRSETTGTWWKTNSSAWSSRQNNGFGSLYTIEFSSANGYEFVYANHDILNYDGSLYREGGTVLAELVCDGSSCSATDIDHDGICDDCGMQLMNLGRTPTAPEVTGNNKHFVMFYTGDTYYYTAYTSDTAYSIRGYNYGTRMRSTSDIAVNVQRFESYDGLNWQSEYSGSAKDYYPGEQGWTLISSTFNWYDSSENTTDPFFPVPLWAEVEKVTQGEIPGMTEQTTTTMGFLMLCGIGCLALLILLTLFGKRSLIYRG